MLSRDKDRSHQASDPTEAFNKVAADTSSEGKPLARKPEQSLSFSFRASVQPAVSSITVQESSRLPQRALDATQPNDEDGKLVISRGLSLRGEIMDCDHLVIEGQVEADLRNCGKIEILEGGIFKGSATVTEAEIAGRYEGILTVRNTLSIGSAARASGSFRYGCLQVVEGGEIDGDIARLDSKAGDAIEAPPVIRRSLDIPNPKTGPVEPAEDSDTTEGETRDIKDNDDTEKPSQAAAAADRPSYVAVSTRDDASEANVIEQMAASAIALRDLSRFDEAEAIFKAVLDQRPQHVGALTGLGSLERLRGDRIGALGYFEAAYAADPQNPWIRCDVANILRELSRFDEAEAMLNPVIETFPQHVGALTALGHLARQQGNRTDALRYFEAAVAADPQNPWARCDAGNIMRELSRFDEAETMFQRVLETHPQHAGALAGLGHLARQRRDRRAALAYFEAAAAADPQNSWVRCDLANVLREQSRFDEAEALFKAMLESQPKHVGALTGLAHLERQRGDLPAALARFEAAAAADPQNLGLRCDAANILRELSRFDDAEATLRGILKTHPQHIGALVGLGHLARQRQDKAGYLFWFEAAMAIESDNASVRVEFARALRQQGEFARARQVIENVLNDELSQTGD